jgi:hypothetical protein
MQHIRMQGVKDCTSDSLHDQQEIELVHISHRMLHLWAGKLYTVVYVNFTTRQLRMLSTTAINLRSNDLFDVPVTQAAPRYSRI